MRGWGHEQADRNKFSPEVRSRAVRLVFDHQAEHRSPWAAIKSIAAKIGCTPRPCATGCGRRRSTAARAGVPTDWPRQLKALERENRELRRANEILRKASAYFAQAELDRRLEAMIAFIDDHRDAYGVEPICTVLPIAPSTYHAHVAQRIDPSQRSARARRDAALKIECGACTRRTSASMARARSGVSCARRRLGRTLHRRAPDARAWACRACSAASPCRTTIRDKAAPCPLRSRQPPVPGAKTECIVGL